MVNLATLSDRRNKNTFYLGEASFTVDEPNGRLIGLAVFLYLFIHSTNALYSASYISGIVNKDEGEYMKENT